MLQALAFSSESHSCLGSVRGALKPLLSASDEVLLLEVALLSENKYISANLAHWWCYKVETGHKIGQTEASSISVPIFTTFNQMVRNVLV